MPAANVTINSGEVDYSKLVGKKINIVTEQYPGQPLATRVTAISEDSLVIDRSGSSGLVNELINRQHVEVRFEYKGEIVKFTSRIATFREGKVAIPIAPEISPMMRRRFIRFETSQDVRLTFFDNSNILTSRLNKLKWLETSTLNVSGGGMLVEMPMYLNDDIYVVTNLTFNDLTMPELLVGRVRHCRQKEPKCNLVGVEFVIREKFRELMPRSLTRTLPSGLFVFDDGTRAELARYLAEKHRMNL